MALNTPTFHSHDFSSLPVRDIYRLLVSAIVPRPIAFVTTIDEKDVINLAPFSFFNGVSSNPPCLVFSVARKSDGSKKDTLLNLEKNGEFVVNSTEEGIAEQANAASEAFPYGVSELAQVGLDSIPSSWVKPPRIKQSAIHIECRVEQIVEIGGADAGGASLVIGRILGIHVADHVLHEGQISYEKLRPLARLGGSEWLRGGEIFRMKRP